MGFNASVPSDSTISLNTSITNYTGKAFDPSEYDLLSVVEHETDAALGPGSNLDTGSTTGAIRPEDLFRYSAPGVRSYTISNSASSYFSVDGGVTDLIGFNQVGPPRQLRLRRLGRFRHTACAGCLWHTWCDSCLRQRQQTALDAIGYNFSRFRYSRTLVILAAGFGWDGFFKRCLHRRLLAAHKPGRRV